MRMASTGLNRAAYLSPALVAGVKVKGEYRCAGCGYGVTIYRELPRCPMCGSGSWEQLARSPFARSAEAGY
jgi:rubrerythrin